MPYIVDFDMTQEEENARYGKVRIKGISAFPLKVQCEFGIPSNGDFTLSRVPIAGDCTIMEDANGVIRIQHSVLRADGNDRDGWTVSDSIEKRIKTFGEYMAKLAKQNQIFLMRTHRAALMDKTAAAKTENDKFTASIAANQQRILKWDTELLETEEKLQNLEKK